MLGDNFAVGSEGTGTVHLLDGKTGAILRTFDKPVLGGRFGWSVAALGTNHRATVAARRT